MAVLALTGVNWLGLREGALVQNVATVLKFGALLVLVVVGLSAPAPVAPTWGAPLPPGSVVAALGLGLVAVLWTYDGWYVLTFSAGEIRRPERNLPRGLVLGVTAVAALYLAINWVYLKALDLRTLAGTSRVGEAAAAALLGPGAARAVTLVILLSMFGCLAANVLCCARIYLPMAEDGLFFRAIARIHPRHHTPSNSLLAQGVLAAAIALSGTYAELYTTVIFAQVLFHAATAAAVFVLRWKRPARHAAVPGLGPPLEHRRVRGRVSGGGLGHAGPGAGPLGAGPSDHRRRAPRLRLVVQDGALTDPARTSRSCVGTSPIDEVASAGS